MNAKMMEGLVGASMNAKLSDTPMSVYEQASREGDTGKMQRALGLAGECTQQAEEYQKKVEKGREEEKKAEREKEKIEQEEALEKSRQEKKEAQKAAEKSAQAGSRPSQDTVEISDAGKAALQDGNTAPQESPAQAGAQAEPVTYTENGAVVPTPEPESTVAFLA